MIPSEGNNFILDNYTDNDPYIFQWGFTLPGPRMPFNTKASYKGVSGEVWGAHVYTEATKAAYVKHGIMERPIMLGRDGGRNWRTPDPTGQTLASAGSPAHHRYPVCVPVPG